MIIADSEQRTHTHHLIVPFFVAAAIVFIAVAVFVRTKACRQIRKITVYLMNATLNDIAELFLRQLHCRLPLPCQILHLSQADGIKAHGCFGCAFETDIYQTGSGQF